MPKFTLSQLDAKPTTYSILDTDLLMLTIGTDTPFLSSVKVSTKQFGAYVKSAGVTTTMTVSASNGNKTLTFTDGILTNVS